MNKNCSKWKASALQAEGPGFESLCSHTEKEVTTKIVTSSFFCVQTICKHMRRLTASFDDLLCVRSRIWLRDSDPRSTAKRPWDLRSYFPDPGPCLHGLTIPDGRLRPHKPEVLFGIRCADS